MGRNPWAPRRRASSTRRCRVDTRNDQNRHLGAPRPQRLDESYPVYAVHDQVGNHQVESLTALDHLERIQRRIDRHALIAIAYGADELSQAIAEHLVVVNNRYFGFFSPCTAN